MLLMLLSYLSTFDKLDNNWWFTPMLISLLLMMELVCGHRSVNFAQLGILQSSPQTYQAIPIEFREFFAPSTELKPSAKLLSLNGKRVQVVGFMAQMEDAPDGAFYLCARPVMCDEGGAGIGDLPVESVLVKVRSMAGQKVAYLPGALQVTGVLQLGGEPPSGLSIVLDGPTEKH